jgi:hypothetical protein
MVAPACVRAIFGAGKRDRRMTVRLSMRHGAEAQRAGQAQVVSIP